MYDYGLSTLEQYGLTAESTARTRGGLLCHTEKGLVIVKEFKGTEKKLQKQQELLLQIQSQGGKVDCYIPNQEENLVSRDRDGIPYTMQHWYEGRECDTRSKEDIFKKYSTPWSRTASAHAYTDCRILYRTVIGKWISAA